MIDFGAIEVAPALPALRSGPALVEACDHLIEALGNDPYAVQRVIDVLRAHPDTPPSRYLRRVTAEVGPRTDHGLFERAAPYLLDRGVDVERVRAKIRIVAEVDVLPSRRKDAERPATDLIICALVHEPEAALALIRRGLAHASDTCVADVAALLVTIGQPWCTTELRGARSAAQHATVLEAALARLGLASTTPADPEFDRAIERWRVQVDLLPPAQRRALEDAKVGGLN